MWDQVASSLAALQAERQAVAARQARAAAFDAWADSASKGALDAIWSTLDARIPEMSRAAGSAICLTPIAPGSAGVDAFSIAIHPCTVHVYVMRFPGHVPCVHLAAAARRGGRQEAIVSQPACLVAPAEAGYELLVQGDPVTAEAVAVRAITLLIDACRARIRY
jgi:hypothetical protein